jgi:hypothetical protein
MLAEQKPAPFSAAPLYIEPEISQNQNQNQRQEVADTTTNNQASIDPTSSFSRATAQDDIAAAVARVKAKREAKLAAATRDTLGDSE